MTSHDPHDDGLTAAERAALGQEYSRDHELTDADRRSFAEFAAEKKHWNPTEEEDMSDNKDRYLRVNEDGVITVGGEVLYDASGQLSSSYLRSADLATHGAGACEDSCPMCRGDEDA